MDLALRNKPLLWVTLQFAPLGLCNKSSPYYFNAPESTDFNKSKASLNCLSISK